MSFRLRLGRLVTAGALTLSLAGCGNEQVSPNASGHAMTQAPRTHARPANRAPVIQSVSFDPALPQPSAPLRAIARVTDADGDSLKISYQWMVRGRPLLGEGASVTLPALRKSDAVRVTILASDGESQSEPFTKLLRVGNTPPRLVELRIRTQAESVWVVDPVADDPDGDRLVYRYTWLVNGEDHGDRSPAFSKRDVARGDEVSVRVVAFDGQDESVPLESATVTIGNSPPDIVSAPPGIQSTGIYRYPIRAEDQDGDSPLRYELMKGPDGMQISGTRGVLEWQPGIHQAGLHEVEIAVDDLHGGRTLQSFSITVNVSRPSSPAHPQ